MKMQFTMVLQGKETLENKFKEAIQDNPQIHMELIRGMAQIVMLAFRLKEEDGISVESFRASKVEEPISQPIPSPVKEINCIENQECNQTSQNITDS